MLAEEGAHVTSLQRKGIGLDEDTFDGGGTAAALPGAPSSAIALPAIGPSVIKTARVDIEVKTDTFQDSFDEASDIARAHGGFVLSSQTAGDDSKRGRIVIRVPSTEFERAMSDARALGKIKGEEVAGQDVSQEFVDLGARLRNYTAQEAVLLKLMDSAQSVTDTIRVQRELEDIQLQIERLRGRLRFLEDQTAFGTISIGLREAGAVTPQPGSLVKAWRNSVRVFMAVVSGVIVAAGVVVPVGLMILVAALILRWLLPGLLRRPSSGAPGATP
jgi:Domain of unknown function (DUF4349)